MRLQRIPVRVSALAPSTLLAASLVLAACSGSTGTQPSASSAPAPSGAATASSPGAGPAGQAGSAAPSGDICVDSINFMNGKPTPDPLVVRPNCAVLFTNRDDTVIQIQSTDFQLGEIGKDQSWAHTYKEPGEYPYFNVKDPSVKGTVIVRPSGG